MNTQTHKHSHPLLTILGPTASGKTRLAALVADRLNAEIISADSRQVYRGMNLGTGKDYADYMVDGKQIPCHLIDIADPGEEYNLFRYQKDFFKVFEDITGRNKVPVMCGGTGLYIEAILAKYDLNEAPFDETLRTFLKDKSHEELVSYLASLKPLHNTTDNTDRERTLRAIEIATYEIEQQAENSELPDLNPIIIGIAYERKNLRQRITQRLKERLEQGMVAEVEELLNKGIKPEKLDFYGLEYRYLTRFQTGQITYEEMFSQLNTAIHQFAKRQMTWFRRMERKGFRIHWLAGEMEMEEKIRTIKKLPELKNNNDDQTF
jgi:tRNA dimethylallyltransferase